jgi:LysR family transcriptional regulator, transcriptional activator of the cysJI operon
MTTPAHARVAKGEALANQLSEALSAALLNGRSEAGATRLLGMTLNQFALFVAVAKCLSLTKASAEMGISQPSISQQLKQLEQTYGAKLYNRLSKGIEITPVGKAFLRQVIPILEQVAKLAGGGRAREMRGVTRDSLTVGGTFSASAVLLPALLARLRQQHPNAELEFRTSTSENLERCVLNSVVDLAVTNREPASKELIGELLQREKVVAFVPPSHALARRKFVLLVDLLAEPLIIRGGKGVSGTTENGLKRLSDLGHQVSIAMRCAEPAAIKAAVRQKMGVGVAFADSIEAEVDSGEFKILKVRGLGLEAKSYIVYPRKRALSPLAQDFLQLLRQVRSHGARTKAKPKVKSESAVTRRTEPNGFGHAPAEILEQNGIVG